MAKKTLADESKAAPPKADEATPKTHAWPVKRELSAKDLASSHQAVQMLKNENARLEIEVRDLRSYRDRFHDSDRENAVLREKCKRTVGGDIVAGSCFVLSGLALGNIGTFGLIAGIVGVGLLLTAVLALWVAKK